MHILTKPASPVRSRARAWRFYRARPSSLIMALLAVFGASAGFSFAQNVIVPKGTTATQLQVNGAVTDITTGTIRGNAALNAFSRFEVDRNNTVNLIVPSNAQYLLNMVTDAPVTVNGVVNSLKDGRIGGNVVFADPFGMIVGSSGALNVGSLLVTTPSRGFIDGVIKSDGSIDSLSVSALLDGSAPGSGLGTIRIDGQVNARDFIRLQGAAVNVNGALRAGAGAELAHQAAFLGAVNAGALEGGAALVERGGVIEIVASGDVALAGTVSADGRNAAAGTVDVRAGHDLTVAPGASVSARGQGAQSDGGRVLLVAAHDAVLGAGASLDASAGSSGDGGFIEFSAANLVTIDRGAMRAGAAGGQAGKVLIDPATISWTSTDDRFNTDGTSIEVLATESIVLNDVVLSTRNVGTGTPATRTNIESLASVGASGNITLKAPSITLSGGTRLLAFDQGVPAGAGGIVRLEATTEKALPSLGLANATSEIKLESATIKANQVDLIAKNTVDSRYVYDGDGPVEQAAGLAMAGVQSVLGAGAELVGASLVYSDVVAKATITVGAGSVIEARGRAALAAQNDTKAGIASKIGLNGVPGITPFGIGASYVSNASEATVVVASGARISAAELTIRAHNDASVIAQTKAPSVYDANQDAVAIAFSATNTDVNATARVDAGATLSVSGALTVSASNVGSFVNESSTETGNEGQAAASVAYATHNSSANAALNASVLDAARVSVLAVNDVQKDMVSASSSVGASAAGAVSNKLAAQTLGRGEKFMYGFLGLKDYKPKEDLAGAESNGLRIGGAIAVANNKHTAAASVGNASNIHATESALVAARVIASDFKIGAASAAVSQSSDQQTSGTAKSGYSAGLSIANITRDASAVIGENAVVTAPKIAVSADTIVPIRNNLSFESGGVADRLTRWTRLDAVTDAMNSLGDFNAVSSAKASGDGSDESSGIYGSLSLLTMNDNARAEIGAGAKLRISGHAAVTAATPWNTSYELRAKKDNDSRLGLSGDTPAITQTFSYEAPATVGAYYDATYMFLAGQLPGSGSARSLGASIGQATLNSKTQAIVREGAVIEGIDETAGSGDMGSRTWVADSAGAADQVVVEAESEQRVVSLASAGGAGATFGLNGTLTYTAIDAEAAALIDDEALVNVKSLALHASSTPVLWSIAGSLNHASSASIGVGIAINKVDSETKAEIADNDTLSTGPGPRASAMTRTDTAPTIRVRDLLVDARTGGAIKAISVAGSLAYNSADDSPGFFTKLGDAYKGAVKSASDLVDTVTFTATPGTPAKSTAPEKTKKEPTFTFGGAGSASANQTELRTSALIAGIVIDQGDSATTPHALTVRAVGDADISAGSGAAAITWGGADSSKSSTGIAGSVAINQLGNGTSAEIRGTTVTNAGDVTVQALTGGEQLAVGIALAVTGGGANTESTNQMVGSVSVTQTLADDDGDTKNFARAGVKDATITAATPAAGAGAPAFDVTAYNRSFIGTGGGSLGFTSGKGEGTAAGVAFSYAQVANHVQASVDHATVKQFQSVAVNALNATEIAAGAAFAGGSTAPKASAYSGSSAVSIIENTTSATIGGVSTVEALGKVSVKAADSGIDNALEELIDPDGKRNSVVPGLDYCAGQAAGAAPSGSCITSAAGMLQIGSGDNYGLSLGYNQISNRTSASIGDATVKATGAGGSIDVLADAQTSILSISAGVGASGKMAGAGSVSLNFVDNRVEAQVGNAAAASRTAVLEAASIEVRAVDRSTVRSLAGQISVGESNSVGAALTVNDSHSQVSATIVNADLTASTSVTVDAGSRTNIDSIAVAGALSTDGNAGAGSLALNFIRNDTDALVRGTTSKAASAPIGNTVGVLATDTSEIRALSGAAGLATNVGVGAAFSFNSIGNAGRAIVDTSTLEGVDALTLTGKLDADIESAAIALGVSMKEAALAGSVTINEIGLAGNVASAELNNSTVKTSQKNGSRASVVLTASDESEISSLAGAVAIGKQAGIGAALADNGIATTVTARLNNSSVQGARVLDVSGTSTALIRSLSAAGAGGSDLGAAGSGSANRIANKTYAEVVDSEVDGGKAVVEVTAEDKAAIDSLAGAGAVGGTAALGGSVALNMVGGAGHTQVAQARVSGKKEGTNGLNVSSLLVQGSSASTIRTIAAAGAVAGTGGIGGSVVTNIVAKDVAAFIDGGARVDAADNIGVLAFGNDKNSVFAGGLGAGGGLGIGLSSAFNQIDGSVRAYVDGAGTMLDARAIDAGKSISVNSGTLANPIDVGSIQAPRDQAADLEETRLLVRGLAVNASSHQSVNNIAVSAGITGGISGAVVPIINLMGGETSAFIQSAKVNTNAGAAAGADVNVLASSHGYAGNFAAGAAAGQGAASGAASANRTDRSTSAYIADATIGNAATLARTDGVDTVVTVTGTPAGENGALEESSTTTVKYTTITRRTLTSAPSVGAVNVQARASQASADIVTGLAAGLVAGTASGAVTIFGGATEAYVERGALTANSLAVDASSKNAYNMLVASVAGGLAGAGGAFGVGIADARTEARVGDKAAASQTTSLKLGGPLSVSALTESAFNGTVASGGVGGIAGVAGTAAVTLVNNHTSAGIYNVATAVQAPAAGTTGSVTDAQGNVVVSTDRRAGGLLADVLGAVTVDAGETIVVKPIAGALGVGLLGGGAGAAANVVVVKSAVTAEILGSAIDSGAAVKVDAHSDKFVDMIGLSSGAGATTGIGGALGLLMVGSGASGNADAELDKDDNGTLTQVNAMTTQPSAAAGAQDGRRAAPRYDIKTAVKGLDADAVTARVAGGSVKAATLTVSALAGTSTSNLAGGAGVSALLGAGGAAGVSRVYSTVNASIDDAAVKAGSVAVTALAKDGSRGSTAAVTSYAGGLGLVGLGAAVSDALVQNKVTAFADGTFTGSAGGDMLVKAQDNSSVKTDGVGASAGALAIGVVVSHADKRSTIEAGIGAGSSVAGYQLLSVAAGADAPVSGATVLANATGAAGGLLAAGTGAESVADNRTRVSASVGNDVRLPDGNVSITAINDSRQHADAAGYAGAGLFAASGAVARANSGSAGERMTTTATLGNNAGTNTGRAGYLQVSASGVDTNTASAVAAAGGVVAGNASQASTSDYAELAASVGSGATIHAGAVTISADHIDSHHGNANSLNASLLGGSGANASHTADVKAGATVRDDTRLAASGTVQVLADNLFDNGTGNRGESASGAGGGVVNGAAVSSSTDIAADTDVRLGDRVTISSGPASSASQYGLVLRAANRLSLSDTVVLRTGGVIAGAGVASRTNALLDSAVATGLGNQLSSLGSIGIGTYTQAGASAEALVETHGLAAVGTAHANADIAANQSVSIGGGNSLIRSFGNLDISAGKDPTGDFNTILSGNASAQGYVRGLIAVPVASASTTLSSNAALDIAAGATVESAQNANVGAFQGASFAQSNGTGRGFELGFIPVTSSDSKTATPSSANVRIDGNVNAGIYHDLRITIDDCGDRGVYCSKATQSADSAPTTIEFLSAFDAAGHVRANFADPATSELMLSGVAPGLVGATKIGALYAAGGTITVNAANISGSGVLTSHGAPKIEVINNSANYLVIDSVTIPNTPGGAVLFSGTAGREAAEDSGIRLFESGADAAPVISIHNTYGGKVGGADFGPALMLMGDVNNLGGKVEIFNKTGSIGQNGQILGLQVNIDAPQGVYVAEFDDSRGPFYAGSNPYSEWQKAMLWPGGNPSDAAPSADWAIAYVANAVESGADRSSLEAFNRSFIHYAGAAQGSNFSKIYFGNAFRHQNVVAGANSQSPIGHSYNLSNQDNSYIAAVPLLGLTQKLDYTAANIKSTGAGSAIHGSKVAIKAKYIDINGKLTAGQPTDWALTVPASLAGKLAETTHLYRTGRGSALYTIDPAVLGLDTMGASGISATFDAVTQQITLANVSASSGGGSIRLEGQILSTNKLGNIHVNGGYGKINVVNDSGYALKIQDINAGSGKLLADTAGKVEIIDTSFNASQNHVLYTYTPNEGVQVYRGAAWQSADQLQKVGDGSGANATYNPLANMRWEWTQEAQLSRKIESLQGGLFTTTTNWQFVGNPNQPWTQTGGKVVMGNAGDAYFEQKISATAQTTSKWFGYGGCDNPGEWVCNYGFLQTSDPSSPRRGWWEYRYVNAATLKSTSSVKADNPITIDFTGNSTGTVSIKSNAAVQIAGQIINPNGTTSIETGDAISQGAKSSLQTQHLNLSAGQGIGSAGQAIRATLGDDGVLNAKSGAAGIHLELASGATLGSVAAGTAQAGLGDVRIAANGSLLAQAGVGTNVSGNNIDLVSKQGAVGGPGAPMIISAAGNPGINGAIGGVVNVRAHANIDLRQVGGDLLVGQIASTGNGDVTIGVTNGTIYDARGQTAANTLSDEQVRQVWDALKLTADRGAETGKRSDASVVAFEGQVRRDYQKYWDLRQRGSIDGAGQLVLDADNLALLRAAAGPGASDAQVAQFANKQYTDARQALADAFGGDLNANTGWEAGADFTGYNRGFAFVATDGQIADLTRNAVWNVNELSYSIHRSALEPTPSQQVGSGTANIIGRAVTIDTAGAVGKLAPSVGVSLADLASGNLTNIQKAALGVAKAPGDIKLTGLDGQNREVLYDFNNAPAGVTMTGFRLAQTSPLFIDATGAIKVNARGGSVFLQGTGVNRDLQIDQVTATSDVSLTAPQSIVAASGSQAPVHIVAGGDVRLTGGNGDLGSATEALAYRAGGILQLATAGQSMFLRTDQGNMRLGGIAAGKLVRLDATDGSILAANRNAGLSIRGQDVVLNAAIDLGAADNALRVGTGEAGAQGILAGTAGGSAWLYAPGAGEPLQIGSLEAGGTIQVGAAGNLAAVHLAAGGAVNASGANVSIDEATGGDLQFNATGDLALGQIGANGSVTASATGATRVRGSVVATGNIAVSASALDMDADSVILAGAAVDIAAGSGDAVLAHVAGTGVAITTGGRIRAVQGGVNVAAGGAAGHAALRSQEGIGLAGAAIGIDAATLAASSARGDIALDLWSGTRAFLIESDGGAVGVHARASLDAARIAGTSVALATAGDLAADAILASGGAIDITTGGAAAIARLDSAGTSVIRATGAIALGQADVGLGAAAGLSVSGGGDLTLSAARVGGDVHLDGGAVSVYSVLAGGDIAVDARGALDAVSLDAGRDLRVRAAGRADIATAQAAGDMGITAAGIGFDALAAGGALRLAAMSGDLAGSSLSAASLLATAVDNVALTRADVRGDAALSAGADLRLGTVLADGDLAADAGGTASAGELVAGQALRLAAAGDVGFDRIVAGADASLLSGHGSVSGTRVDAATLSAGAQRDMTLAQVTVAGATTVLAGARLEVGDLVAGGDARLEAGGALSLGNARASNDITVDAASAAIGALEAGGDARLAVTGGNLSVDSLGAATLTAAVSGNALLTQANMLGAATVDAGGALTVGRFAAAGNASLRAGGAATIDQVDVGGTNVPADLAVSSGGAQSVGTASASGDIALEGATLVLGSGTAGRDMRIAVTDRAELARANAGSRFDLDAASAAIGALEAGADARLAVIGGNLSVDMLGAATLTAAVSGNARLTQANVLGAATVDAGGALTVGRFAAAGNTSLRAGGAANLEQVDVGGVIALAGDTLVLGTGTAGRDMRIAVTGLAELAQASAGGSVDLRAGSAGFGTIGAGAGARLATGANLAGDALRAASVTLTAGGDARIGTTGSNGATVMNAGGELALGDLASLGATELGAGGSVALGTVKVGDAAHASHLRVTAGTSLSASAIDAAGDAGLQGQALALGAVRAGGELAVQAGRGVAYNRLDAGGDLLATVADELRGGSGSVLTSARDVRIEAASFAFDQAGAGRGFAIDPVGDVTGNALDAGADVLIKSSGTINVARMRAAGEADLSALGAMHVGQLSAASLSASTPGVLSMDVLVGAGKLRVGAGSIEMKVKSGGPRLEFDMAGYQGGVAERAVLAIDAPAGTSFARFRAKNAELTTNADSNTFASAYITGAMRFTNPSGQMYMNNVDPTSVAGPLLQLVQPTFGFTLAQEGLYYLTDAYVTQYMPQYRPISPNHQEDRTVSAIMAYGASAGRSAGSEEGRRSAPRQDAQSVFQRAAADARPQLGTVSDGAEAVNWGDEVTALPAGEIQIAAASRAYPDQ